MIAQRAIGEPVMRFDAVPCQLFAILKPKCDQLEWRSYPPPPASQLDEPVCSATEVASCTVTAQSAGLGPQFQRGAWRFHSSFQSHFQHSLSCVFSLQTVTAEDTVM